MFSVRLLHDNRSGNMGGFNDSLTIVVQVLEPWVLTVVQVSVEKFLVRRQGTNVFIVNSMSSVMERSRWFHGKVSPILMVLHNHWVFDKGRRSLLMLVMLNRKWMMRLNRNWISRQRQSILSGIKGDLIELIYQFLSRSRFFIIRISQQFFTALDAYREDL